MARFRKAADQATHAVSQASAIGQSRHPAKDSNKVHSYGTQRNYHASLKRFGIWLTDIGNRQGIDKVSPNIAMEYLDYRSQIVGQKQLDQDRQALQKLPQITEKLSRIQSEKATIEKARAYTTKQIKLIVDSQSERFALATEIASAAGLRAHELFTIRPMLEQPVSAHRPWREDRFAAASGIFYSVIGKGGLVRQIIIPHHLAEKLERLRLPTPKQIVDRKIRYESHYGIVGGQSWSQNFSRMSKHLFGWSHGAHGLRHTFAQNRVTKLQALGQLFNSALEITSQEMGHFRTDITLVYLR